MSYKRAFWFIFTANCLYLGFNINHDSYNIFLAVGAVLISYGTAVYFFAESKPRMIILFVFLAVILCQLSVFGRARITEDRQEDDSTGYLLGDIVYGIKKIPQNLHNAREGLSGNYDLLNEVNYRLLTLSISLPAAGLFIALRKPVEKPVARKRVKERPLSAYQKAD